jgi:hypothetical protein
MVTSPLSAIPKSDDKIRVIHDLSAPRGNCLNEHASKDPVKFQTVEEAISMFTPGAYMAKVDLRAAYKSVRIHPACQQWTAFQWTLEGGATYLLMWYAFTFWGAQVACNISSDYSGCSSLSASYWY